MAIQAGYQVAPIVVPTPGLAIATSSGAPTNNFRIAQQQMHGFVVGVNRLIPCNATMALNVITLSLLPAQPDLTQYASYDGFSFTAPDNSTGPVTAQVVITAVIGPTSLGILKVYNNTGAQVGSGGIVKDALYRFYFNDALDSGAGGFVKDGGAATAVTSLTNSSGGVVSNTIAAVSGSGDDTHINNNFASLAEKINAIAAAIGVS